MTQSSLNGNSQFVAARPTSEEVFSSIAATDRRKNGALFIQNPTTGALEVRPDFRPKIRRAISAEARRLQLRLYLSLPRLYLRKLSLQLLGASLQGAGKLRSLFLDFAPDRHG
jgi:hypothetical protein